MQIHFSLAPDGHLAILIELQQLFDQHGVSAAAAENASHDMM